MPNKVGRNINLCFTKIKRPSSLHSLPMSATPQAPDDHDRPSILIKNYNSLYDHDHPLYYSTTLSTSSSSYSGHFDFTSTPTADFATAFASHRFFFSSPGRSNSIIESTSPSYSASSATTLAESNDVLFTNGVAVSTFSPDPYKDFRMSMEEMVEAREQMEAGKSSWEFLHELLLCYLALNPKSTHEFILGAFADLVVSLMPLPPEENGGCRVIEYEGGECVISEKPRPMKI